MHPKAALLALLGYVPMRIYIPHEEQSFIIVKATKVHSVRVEPTLTLDWNSRFGIMYLIPCRFQLGTWYDMTTRGWDTLDDRLLEEFKRITHAS